MKNMQRREFVRLTGGALAAMALPGCASVAATRLSPVDGVVRLAPRDVPQLDRAGGSLRVEAEGTGLSFYLMRLDDGSYLALSPICTHLGCTVGLEGDRLVCPCHGSTYDREGNVIRGPAERPLRRFPVSVGEGGELLIRLDGVA